MSNANVIENNEAWFETAINEIANTDLESFDSFFSTIETTVTLQGTSTQCRVHWINADANGRVRVKALAEHLATVIIDYCIPRSKVLEALDGSGNTTSRLLYLAKEAKSYFTDAVLSGEGGELLLYFLMEKVLGIPQILCKMSLKTDPNVHIHGTDGVHARALPNGKIAVYWCEAKVYASYSDALSSCLDSLETYLNDPGGGKLQQDLYLVKNYLDVGNQALASKLVQFFTTNSENRNNLEMRGACLIGFDEVDYPSPEELSSTAERLVTRSAKWREDIGAKINAKRINDFVIEFFCLPMPAAADFRAEIRQALGIANG